MTFASSTKRSTRTKASPLKVMPSKIMTNLRQPAAGTRQNGGVGEWREWCEWRCRTAAGQFQRIPDPVPLLLPHRRDAVSKRVFTTGSIVAVLDDGRELGTCIHVLQWVNAVRICGCVGSTCLDLGDRDRLAQEAVRQAVAEQKRFLRDADLGARGGALPQKQRVQLFVARLALRMLCHPLAVLLTEEVLCRARG